MTATIYVVGRCDARPVLDPLGATSYDPAMDDHIQSRADRVLDDNLMLIEDYWTRSGLGGMGRRYIDVVENPRPDRLVAFAIRPAPWEKLPCPVSWDEWWIVVVIRLIEGTAVRSIPAP